MVSTCPLWMVHCPQSWKLLLPSNFDPCHQLSSYWKNVSWFHKKCIMPTTTSTPYDTITRKSLFQLNSIFSNASSTLKSQQSPNLKFQGCPLQKLFLHLQGCLHLLHNIFTISLLQHKSSQISSSRQIQNFSKNCHLLFLHHLILSPTLTLKNFYIDNTDADFTIMNICAKLQHLVQQ